MTAAAHTATTLPCVAEPPAPEQRPAPAPDHLERSIGVGIVWKLAGQVGVQSIRLVTVAILAPLLVPADYGAAAIAVALASFAPTVGDMGMGSALVQSPTATQRERSTVFWSSLAFGCALAVLGAVASVPIGMFVGEAAVGTMVAVGALTFAIYSLGATSQAVFVRGMRFRGIELRYWFALLVGSAVAIVGATAGLGAWALVLQQLALLSASVASLWWRAGWHPTLEFSRAVFRPLFSFAIRIAGGRWARLFELVILSLLIAKLLDVAALGAWTFAMSTVILPLTVIMVPIAEVLFSAFSRLQGQRERVAALWLDSLGFLAAVIVPVLVGLVVVAPDLIPAVFGSQWRVSVTIIQILSFYVIIRSLQAWNSPVLDAAGKPQVTLWTQVAALCLTPRRHHRLPLGSRSRCALLRRRPADSRRGAILRVRALGAGRLADHPRGAAACRCGRDGRDGGRVPARPRGARGARRRDGGPGSADDRHRRPRVPHRPPAPRARPHATRAPPGSDGPSAG